MLRRWLLAALVATFASRAMAVESVEAATRRYAGDWATSVEWSNDDAKAPFVWKGTVRATAIGTNWLAVEHAGDFLGMGYEANESLGFDAGQREWTSIWVSRMQSYIRIMNGSIDADGTLRLVGKIQDDKGSGWLDVKREDCWIDDGRYISTYEKFDGSGKRVERLVVRAQRVGFEPAVAKPAESESRCKRD
jgi:hypothetical protein